MSDALTPNAPSDVEAAPEAPAPEVAVDGASAGAETPQVVPAERFNGLQRKYQSDKTEWENRLAAMQAELTSLREQEQEKPNVPDDNEALRAEVQALREMLVEERTTSARDKVLDQYPGAKPFADLIVGGSPEEMEQVARTLDERMKVILGGESATPPADPPSGEAASEPAPAGGEPAPEAPEHTGTVTATGTETLVDAKAQAIQNRDFESFLAAASALQEASMAQVS
jgi:hypothetical protein